MASGELNAFNVSWLSLNLKHYWTYLPWFHEKKSTLQCLKSYYKFRSKELEDNCTTVEE